MRMSIIAKRSLALLLAMALFGYFVLPTGTLKTFLGVAGMLLIPPYIWARSQSGDPDKDPSWDQ